MASSSSAFAMQQYPTGATPPDSPEQEAEEQRIARAAQLDEPYDADEDWWSVFNTPEDLDDSVFASDVDGTSIYQNSKHSTESQEAVLESENGDLRRANDNLQAQNQHLIAELERTRAKLTRRTDIFLDSREELHEAEEESAKYQRHTEVLSQRLGKQATESRKMSQELRTTRRELEIEKQISSLRLGMMLCARKEVTKLQSEAQALKTQLEVRDSDAEELECFYQDQLSASSKMEELNAKLREEHVTKTRELEQRYWQVVVSGSRARHQLQDQEEQTQQLQAALIRSDVENLWLENKLTDFQNSHRERHLDSIESFAAEAHAAHRDAAAAVEEREELELELENAFEDIDMAKKFIATLRQRIAHLEGSANAVGAAVDFMRSL